MQLTFRRVPKVPEGLVMVRCKECHTLLSMDMLSKGECPCGRRVMQGTTYLGLWEYLKIMFFGFRPVLVGSASQKDDTPLASPREM